MPTRMHTGMNQLQTGKASLVAVAGKKNPDVIVTHTNQTALFKTQNRRFAASEFVPRLVSHIKAKSDSVAVMESALT